MNNFQMIHDISISYADTSKERYNPRMDYFTQFTVLNYLLTCIVKYHGMAAINPPMFWIFLNRSRRCSRCSGAGATVDCCLPEPWLPPAPGLPGMSLVTEWCALDPESRMDPGFGLSCVHNVLAGCQLQCQCLWKFVQMPWAWTTYRKLFPILSWFWNLRRSLFQSPTKNVMYCASAVLHPHRSILTSDSTAVIFSGIRIKTSWKVGY